MDNRIIKGALYLIPSPIAEYAIHSLPASVVDAVERINIFVVERLRTARRFIRLICKEKDLDNILFFELNKHGDDPDLRNFLKIMFKGEDVGLISEAGLPAVADPGQNVVAWAHENNIRVIPLSGPSSIFLALMASGLNGQQFCFHAYLSNKKSHLIRELKILEHRVRQTGITQIFMDTPYRNMFLLEACMEALCHDTLLCIACDLTGPNENIKTQKIEQWKKTPIEYLNKQAAIFLIGKL